MRNLGNNIFSPIVFLFCFTDWSCTEDIFTFSQGVPLVHVSNDYIMHLRTAVKERGTNNRVRMGLQVEWYKGDYQKLPNRVSNISVF